MDRPDARARQHRDDRFRDHRHVDDHPVAALDSLRDQDAREPRDEIAQLEIREGSRRLGDRRVVDQRELVGAASLDVPVERVVTGVQAPAAEPAIERRPGVVEHPRPGLDPVDRLGRLGPELLSIFERAAIDLVKPGDDGPPSPRPYAPTQRRSKAPLLDEGEEAPRRLLPRRGEAHVGRRLLGGTHGRPSSRAHTRARGAGVKTPRVPRPPTPQRSAAPAPDPQAPDPAPPDPPAAPAPPPATPRPTTTPPAPPTTSTPDTPTRSRNTPTHRTKSRTPTGWTQTISGAAISALVRVVAHEELPALSIHRSRAAFSLAGMSLTGPKRLPAGRLRSASQTKTPSDRSARTNARTGLSPEGASPCSS